MELAQIAWVIPDIVKTKKMFEEVMGVKGFSDIMKVSTDQYKGTYYGKLSNEESFVSMAYSGGIFIELIQPIKGPSIFEDYLKQNPGGGIQHFAYRVPLIEYEKVIADYKNRGYKVASDFDTNIAMISIFDTTKELGVMTEIMGVTEEGVRIIEGMKRELTSKSV